MSAARVAVLGASNVALGLPQLCAAFAASGVRRADFVCGHGRSYGLSSSVPLRTLPSIGDAPLWDDDDPRTIDAALLADAGNDLVYGVPPETTLAWVERDALRLETRGARIVLGDLPLASLRALTPRRYAWTRRLLFPFHALGYAEAQAGVEQLHAGLAALALRRGWVLWTPEAGWYGLDPIHVRRAARTVWASMAARLLAGEPAPSATLACRDWARVRLLRPRRETWLGVERRGTGRAQLANGLLAVCH